MKKAAVISLILLLVVSLGTSGYLLMDQKKIKAELDELTKEMKATPNTPAPPKK